MVGEAVPEGFTRRWQGAEVLENVIEVPIGPLGPLRITKNQWGAFGPILTPMLHNFLQHGYHLGNISGAVNDEV